MSFAKALLSGFIGACTLTIIHETARRFVPDAPRMDILGMRAISKSLQAAGGSSPDDRRLHAAALAGDILANSLYYSVVGAGRDKNVLLLGAGLGAVAGVGGVMLPEPLGLGADASARSNATKAMTIGWYLAGGLAAGLSYWFLTEQGSNRPG